MRKNLAFCYSIMLGVLLSMQPREAEAVAFKMKNDSQHTLRMTVYDRGQWRPWVVCAPGFWGDVATSVKRTEHSVAIDYWDGRNWQPLYRNDHGSKMFTRVAQAFNDSQGNVYFAWWDEPPGCRDAPLSIGTGGSTCLKPSGWIYGELYKLMQQAVRVGMAYVLGS